MSPDRAYRWLMTAVRRSNGDGFDLHVCASILAVAIAQADEEGLSLAATSGLDAAMLGALGAAFFPAAAAELVEMAGAVAPAPGPEEQSVVDILLMYASGRLDFVRPLARMIARRCQEPRHLWQDLGLRERAELSQLMQRHFPRLKTRNSGDMKWKKFLYRLVCGSEGFVLCPAPVCSDCDDFAACFGSEEGVAQLSHAYREERLEANPSS
jgi:nitrogen fixation protein NifQ